jgi:hypothetical protein
LKILFKQDEPILELQRAYGVLLCLSIQRYGKNIQNSFDQMTSSTEVMMNRFMQTNFLNVGRAGHVLYCIALSVTKLSLYAHFCNALPLSLFKLEIVAFCNGLQ